MTYILFDAARDAYNHSGSTQHRLAYVFCIFYSHVRPFKFINTAATAVAVRLHPFLYFCIFVFCILYLYFVFCILYFVFCIFVFLYFCILYFVFLYFCFLEITKNTLPPFFFIIIFFLSHNSFIGSYFSCPTLQPLAHISCL